MRERAVREGRGSEEGEGQLTTTQLCMIFILWEVNRGMTIHNDHCTMTRH